MQVSFCLLFASDADPICPMKALDRMNAEDLRLAGDGRVQLICGENRK